MPATEGRLVSACESPGPGVSMRTSRRRVGLAVAKSGPIPEDDAVVSFRPDRPSTWSRAWRRSVLARTIRAVRRKGTRSELLDLTKCKVVLPPISSLIWEYGAYR